jgi:hypothetical protein
MGYSLGQAAKAAGRSKTTVHRAIAGGRLSASRTESGGWSIDPAELARVFPADSSGNGLMERIGTAEPPAEELAQVRADRDRFRALAEERDETIRDLRTRLDAEAEERRKLTAILIGPRRPWWRRWFR